MSHPGMSKSIGHLCDHIVAAARPSICSGLDTLSPADFGVLGGSVPYNRSVTTYLKMAIEPKYGPKRRFWLGSLDRCLVDVPCAVCLLRTSGHCSSMVCWGLVNGTTITVYDPRDLDEPEFFHIKLENHNVIYAEDVPCEL